jgi:hypothetical protein
MHMQLDPKTLLNAYLARESAHSKALNLHAQM